MGNLARQRVWDAAEPKGNERLLLLALADFIPDDGWQCWPSIDTLKDMVGVSDRQIQRLLKACEASGHIAIEPGRGRTHTSRYALLVGLSADERARVAQHLKGDKAVSPFDSETFRKGDKKGDTKPDIAMSPFPVQKGDISEEKVTSGVIKGDIAMSPEPKEPKEKGDDVRSSRKRSARPPDLVFESLADVCRIDWHVCTREQRDQLNQSVGILRKSAAKNGKNDDEVAEAIQYVARWFTKNDWRGKKGEAPTPAAIREVWGAAIAERNEREAKKRTNGYHPPGPPPVAPDDLVSADELAAFVAQTKANRPN